MGEIWCFTFRNPESLRRTEPDSTQRRSHLLSFLHSKGIVYRLDRQMHLRQKIKGYLIQNEIYGIIYSLWCSKPVWFFNGTWKVQFSWMFKLPFSKLLSLIYINIHSLFMFYGRRKSNEFRTAWRWANDDRNVVSRLNYSFKCVFSLFSEVFSFLFFLIATSLSSELC